MNQLIALSPSMTMGTREIADMLGKRHDHIKSSAEKLAACGAILTPVSREFEHRGNTYTEYLLNKLDSITLVAQNCPQFTAALVKRWDELEQGAAKPQIPQTYAAALLEAGRLALELEQSQEQLAIAAPKADIFDKVIERENLLNATQVAQQVGMSAVKMNKQLDLIGGVYSKSVKRGRTFCHGWVEDGCGEMKICESGYPQALFTTKGSLRVVELFTSEGVI